jgi:PAS domain S-box-containing protein
VEVLTSPAPLIKESQPASADIWRGQAFQRHVDALFHQFQDKVYKRTDRLFAILLAAEWICGIIAAWTYSPTAWAGTTSSTHPHVLIAVVLGAIIVALPVVLAEKYPGRALTRHVVAVGQMLMSALLIHITGGRIETHFHIFGSLAFLAFYYDWRVLITASTVVAIDHLVRGLYWPQSVFGTQVVEPWRWVEHTAWVVFQDIFLVWACVVNTKEMKLRAQRQAEIESSHDMVEEQVRIRTAELQASENRMSAQFSVTQCLNRGSSFEDTANAVLESLSGKLVKGTKFAAFWQVNKRSKQMECVSTWTSADRPLSSDKIAALTKLDRSGTDLPALIYAESRIKKVSRFETSADSRSSVAREYKLNSMVGFPLTANESVAGAIELYFAEPINLDDETMMLLASIGRQIGQYVVRRQAEDDNMRLAAVVQSSADAIMGLADDNTISSWNDGAQRLYGLEAEEVLGKDVGLIVPTEKLKEIYDRVLCARQGGIQSFETEHTHRNGSVVHVSVTVSPVYDQKGLINGTSMIARDISDKKEAERRVSEFYSTVSHELRTPLTSIRASLGLMEGGKAGELPKKGQQLVHIARTESDRLIRLINDILDLRKLEAGKLELNIQSWNARTLVSTTIQGVKPLADGASVSLEVEGDLDCEIHCDRDRFIQVLTNLVSNAIKFSPCDSNVRVRGEPLYQTMRFAVIDNGPGIPEDQMHKLFGKFQQLDSSDTRSKGGTGLGLAISKAIVEEHGGTIGFETKVGEGSTFWFELPLASSETANVSNRVMHDILVLEDDEKLCEVLMHALEPDGYRVHAARSIAQAEKLLQKLIPAVILLDVVLPDGDGLEFAERLRHSKQTRNLPIIVITGCEADQEIFNKPMIIDWLKKPFDLGRLETSLDIAVRAGALRTMTVLVVEDDLPTREQVVGHVNSLGLRAVEAVDGLSAIESVHKSHPDLIILDLGIPHMNGFEVVAKLRKESAREIPLIVYSNRELRAEDKERLSLGLTKYLFKAKTTSKDFLSAMRELLGGIVPPVDSGSFSAIKKEAPD